MTEVENEVHEAVGFFTKKFAVDNKHGDKDSNMKDWKACLEYVGKYGLFYEVFVVARETLSEESTFEQCSAAIGNQMSEWDL
tara:strand:- start:319 stop:564 length:246 start_codon:yes stop_codon:yes gene_type:complete